MYFSDVGSQMDYILFHSRGILPKAQPSSLFYQLGEVGNLQLQLVDGVSGPCLLLVGCIHHLPQFLYLLRGGEREESTTNRKQWKGEERVRR